MHGSGLSPQCEAGPGQGHGLWPYCHQHSLRRHLLRFLWLSEHCRAGQGDWCAESPSLFGAWVHLWLPIRLRSGKHLWVFFDVLKHDLKSEFDEFEDGGLRNHAKSLEVGGPCVDLRFIETSQIAFFGAVPISFTGGFYAVASAESMQANGIGAMAPVHSRIFHARAKTFCPPNTSDIGTCVHCNCDSCNSQKNARGSREVSTLRDESRDAYSMLVIGVGRVSCTLYITLTLCSPPGVPSVGSTQKPMHHLQISSNVSSMRSTFVYNIMIFIKYIDV